MDCDRTGGWNVNMTDGEAFGIVLFLVSANQLHYLYTLLRQYPTTESTPSGVVLILYTCFR
jgi:hypothetical protein